LLQLLLNPTDLVLIVLDDSLVGLVGLLNLGLVLPLHTNEQLIEVGLLLILLIVACTL
jgi:hypothetical protein